MKGKRGSRLTLMSLKGVWIVTIERRFAHPYGIRFDKWNRAHAIGWWRIIS